MPSVMDPQYKADLEDLFSAYLAAEKAILNGAQEYTIGDRTLRRADLVFIQKERKKLANDIAKLDAGKGIRSQRVYVIHD